MNFNIYENNRVHKLLEVFGMLIHGSIILHHLLELPLEQLFMNSYLPNQRNYNTTLHFYILIQIMMIQMMKRIKKKILEANKAMPYYIPLIIRNFIREITILVWHVSVNIGNSMIEIKNTIYELFESFMILFFHQ